MKDLNDADKILQVVLDYAKEHEMERVRKISIVLKKQLKDNPVITTENVKSNLILLAKGSIADGAEFNITSSNEDFMQLKQIE